MRDDLLDHGMSASMRGGMTPCRCRMRVRTISTRRLLRSALRPSRCSRSGSWRRSPRADMRRASTPSATKSRTTAPARAPDSSQLRGYCAPEIGCESVWPSTTTGCLRSPRTTPAILSSSCVRLGLSVAPAGLEEHLVGEQLDDQAAAADGDVDLALQAGLLGELVDRGA